MATGTNFKLVFGPGTWGFSSDANRDCDFDKEPGKVRKAKNKETEVVCVCVWTRLCSWLIKPLRKRRGQITIRAAEEAPPIPCYCCCWPVGALSLGLFSSYFFFVFLPSSSCRRLCCLSRCRLNDWSTELYCFIVGSEPRLAAAAESVTVQQTTDSSAKAIVSLYRLS